MPRVRTADLLAAMFDAAGDADTLDALAELAPDVLAGPREEGFGEPGAEHVEAARRRVEERMRGWMAQRQEKV
jgi:hypothetical protein